MEKRRSRYQTLGWRLARERMGQLVRENYRIDQESPRLAAFVKKLENGSASSTGQQQIAADPTLPRSRAPPRGGRQVRTRVRNGSASDPLPDFAQQTFPTPQKQLQTAEYALNGDFDVHDERG